MLLETKISLTLVTTWRWSKLLLFATQSRPLALIPPTSSALEQHILRAAYQAGQIWGRADDVNGWVNLPEPTSWGWHKEQDVLRPTWFTLPSVWSACRELDRCGCTSGCDTRRCKCRRNGLSCFLACKICKGECSNKR